MRQQDSLVKMFARTWREMTQGQRREDEKRRQRDRKAQRALKQAHRYGAEVV